MFESSSQFNSLQQAAYQLSTCTEQIFRQIEHQQTLSGVIDRIRASRDLKTIFTSTAQEIRHILNADRVVVFQFTPGTGGDEGRFVSEDVVSGLPSALEAKIHDHCFGTQYAVHYQKGKVQAVEDIYKADLSDCHISILETFQVRANLIVPVLDGDSLWGLLCVHQCHHPRRWQMQDIEFVQKIATQFSIAIQQANYVENIQQKQVALELAKAQEQFFRRQHIFSTITQKIRRSFDFSDICQTAVDEVRTLMCADRAVIFRFKPDWSGEFLYESVGDLWKSLILEQETDPLIKKKTTDCDSHHILVDTHLQDTQGGPFQKETVRVCPDIYKAGFSDCYVEVLESYQAKAYVIVAIYTNQALWGLLAVFQNTTPRQWQDNDIVLLSQISEQLGIAVQQVEEQQRKINRQKALVQIVGKVRQSLDIATICQTTTDEVRKMLGLDRVLLYKFNPDWSGQVVYESVDSHWISVIEEQRKNPLLTKNVSDCSVQVLSESSVLPPQNDTYLQETKGGPFVRGESFRVCPDIYDAGFSPCYLEFLEGYQARSYVNVAIYIDKKLWGLLGAFQNSAPRQWDGDEVQLLTIVAEHMGIALQQSEYVQTIEHQSKTLEQTLEELKRSQLQLIQQEKMASLGQLVAGIAHEINNPVSFIHGNLAFVQEYAQNLLCTVRLYQKYNATIPSAIQEQIKTLDFEFIETDLPKLLDSMRYGTDRISKIVQSLRTFSRLDEAQFKMVDLHEGIESVLVILAPRLRGELNPPRVNIHRQYGDLPLVTCHAEAINQVFLSILNNAIDAIQDRVIDTLAQDNNDKSMDPDPGEIVITTRSTHPEMVCVSIMDNGIGMNEDILAQVFNPFFTTKSVGKGTGMGMSISHQIITEQHGGSLKCRSTVGKGTKFEIHLPVKYAAIDD
ncbi:MAG: GAF domain-containing protein [Cyanobacteria bacterium P01_F01_bin.150]